MPIFCEPPEERKGTSKLVSYRDYVQLERISTTSVLLRVDYSSTDEEGNFISIKDSNQDVRANAYIEPPEYRTGEYSTLYYLITEEEKELYAIRKNRSINKPLSEIMQKVCEVNNVKVSDY